MCSHTGSVVGERLLRGIPSWEDRQEPNRLEECVGDALGTKDGDVIRVLTQNINGIGRDANNIKENMLQTYITDNAIDVVSIQQLNVCWPHLANKNKIWDRFRGWKESHKMAVAYNRREKSKTYFQPGGTAIMAINKISHSYDSSGVDDARLGRYAWMRFQGSYGRHFRVVSVYRPGYNKKYNSTYMQQLRYSMQHKNGKNPRDLLLEDLQDKIGQWIQEGDGIIVVGDFNEDIRSPSITFWKERLGLHDVMLGRLDDDSLAPPTYQLGSRPIDTILCTAGIEVRSAGYLPFGTGVGDHRPLFVDVTISSTLGVNLPPSKKIVARRLKLNDPRVINNYNAKLKNYFSRHSLSFHVKGLQENITQPLASSTALEYERLDKIRIGGMQYAEKHCRKLTMGGVPWTPELTRIKLTIEVWQLVIRRLKGCLVSARTILRKKNRAGMKKADTNVSLNIAQNELRAAFKEYKEYLNQSGEKRQKFIHELAQVRAKQGKMKVSKQLEIMQSHEAQRISAARIRRMNGTSRASKGIHKVLIPNDAGELIEVNEKTKMEEELLKAYEVTLTQSNLTPCTISPLKEKMGACGNSQFASDLLVGNVCSLEGVDNSTLEVLKYLALKEGTNSCYRSMPLLVEECQTGWKKTKERISSAMVEGTHYGHWKAGYMDDDIAAIHTGFANVAYLSGYSPNRWQYGVNSLIPKEEGNYNIKRLRTILLYEADFNFNNKLLGRRMMQAAEDNGVIAREQYGSRKKMSALDCALNKCLMFDILRQLKRAGGICSCDLHSCYDRVVHSFASVAMQRAGAPLAAIESMFTTIQKLKHVVRTCHGDSVQSFGGESWREINPLQGVGQGNGAAPAIWAVISSVFFDLLRDKGYGFQMKAPLSKLALHLAGCGFVDDTDLLQIGLEDDDYTTVTQKLQEAVLWWETCAKVSGGAVVPLKSWFGLIDFEWIDGEWQYATDMEDVALLVKNANGIETQLKLLQPHEAKRMLGVYLAIDGSNNVQVKHMRKIAETWYDKVRTGHLTRGDAWTALTTTILKTLEYPLLASTLTQKECSYIMAPVLQGGLSKMGVCKTMPRVLVYGPIKYTGLGINQLYTTQGLLHVRAVLDHCWRTTETGKLLRTSIEIAKVETGLQGSLWSYDYDVYSHLCEDTWVKHLWQFLWETGTKITDDLDDFQYVRENDSSITAGFAKAYQNGSITKSQWYIANRCRLYLRCLTVGDIASGNGRSLDTNVLAGTKNLYRARDITWPAQGKPKNTDWVVWRKLLQDCFLNTNKRLLTSLGSWCPCVTTSYMAMWEWWWDNASNTLLRYTNGVWNMFHTESNRGRRSNQGCRYKYYEPMRVIPDVNLLQRTSVTLMRGYYTTQGSAIISYPPAIPPKCTPSLVSFIETLHSKPGEMWAVHEVMSTTDISGILLDIEKGTVVCVSDGSYKDECGTAAWIIENDEGTQRIQGKVAVPGFASDQSAYRSELAGLYAIVYVVETLIEVYGLVQGGVSIGCDGLSALQQAVSKIKTATSAQQHFDLISGIQGYIHDSKIIYQPFHIEGHQDEKTPLVELDRMAVLNIECDAYAKEYLQERTHNGTISARDVLAYHLPKGMWKVSLHGTRLCTHLVDELRESIEGSRTAEYWIDKKKQMTTAGFFRVDWPAVKNAMKSTTVWRRHWVTKFNSGFCGTGRMMKLWKQRIIDTCPRCGIETETPIHILRCPSARASTTWDESMLDLSEWLASVKTCPDILKLICQSLQLWREQLPVLPLHSYDFDGVNAIYTDQCIIGWRNLLRGFVSVEWANVQDKYYKWLGLKRTGKRWVTMLIKKLWDVSWSQWEDRNGALHNTPIADDLSGAASLDAAIKAECRLGSQGLPPHVRCTFPKDVSRLLQSSLHERKCWLQLVRAARELTNDDRIIDVFSDTKSSLRKWIGLHSTTDTQE